MSLQLNRGRPLRIAVVGCRGIGNVQGGIESYCTHFYKELCPYGFDVCIFVRRKSNCIELPRGVRTVHLPIPRTRSLETVLYSFASIVAARLLGIRTLHVHGIGSCLALPVAKALGMRVVIRHVGADYDRSKWGRVAKAVIRLGEQQAARYGDVVVCLTQHIAERFLEATGRSHNVLVIPNGVNPPPSRLSLGILKRLEIVRGQYFLGVGRFVPEKNFHVLVEAFLTASVPPHFKLVLAGEIDYANSYGRQLLETCRASQRVVLPGIVSGQDLWTLYKNCNAFILPSAHEGMSFALLEAGVAGAAIIASDIPANAEVCKEFARLVPAGSASKLRETIEQEWQRERSTEEVERQISLCRSKHDWQAIARSMVSILAGPGSPEEITEPRSTAIKLTFD